MKRFHLIIATLFLMLFAACGQKQDDSTNNFTPSPDPMPTPMQTPSPTPVPDFSETDMTGVWTVTGIISTDGILLDESDFTKQDTDFTLELSRKGVYFVYDAKGKIKGQGSYSVNLNRLTLSAADMEMVYIIIDENTLHCRALDDSITVMTRSADEQDDRDDETQTDVPDTDTPEE